MLPNIKRILATIPIIVRYLAGEKLSSRMLWEHAKHQVVLSENGFIVYDDTVLDKSYANAIDLARYQYSGNSQEVINGIGVVQCNLCQSRY